MKGQEDEEGGEGMRQGCKTETSKRKVRNLALPHFESDVKCGTVVKLHEWCKMLWLGWAAPVVDCGAFHRGDQLWDFSCRGSKMTMNECYLTLKVRYN